MQKRISEETHHALTELSTNAGYPITETLSGSGDLGQVLVDAIKKYDMDLVVCGHHQDFWSKLMSSARQLINTVHVDMLIVPLARRRRIIFPPRRVPERPHMRAFCFLSRLVT
ncbi:universal stress protein A [Escherichia coli]|nr:universal stress protein A [Escherichia coli]